MRRRAPQAVPPPPDQAVRDRAARDLDTTFLLEASAGTGKTTVLIDRILHLLASGRTTLDRLVAITFTEKAAGELKLRVREEIEKAVPAAGGAERERLIRAARDLERAPISTIHAFASALLKERPFEAGLDPGFTISADVAGERSFAETWAAWLDERLANGDPVLVRALHLGLKLEQLERAARRMVDERDLLGRPVPRPPFAPAGAVAEMGAVAARLARMKPACLDPGDGAFQAILALEADVARCARLDGPELESALSAVKITAHLGAQARWSPKSTCAQVKAELKALRLRLEAFAADLMADVAWTLRDRLRAFIDAFEQGKAEKARVDFADLLIRARDTLAGSPAVRRYFQRRFDYLMVDEFQDTDPLQAEIAFFLAEDPDAAPAPDWRAVRLLPGKLFVVGDPKQSIYRFRRADLGVYQTVKELVIRGGGEVLALSSNFRTVPSVIDFVNERFGEIFRQPEDPAPLPLVAFRDEPEGGGARTLLVPIPRERRPPEDTLVALRPVLAKLVAAVIQRAVGDAAAAAWTVVDRHGGRPRPARPGDIALLLRKMTPDLIGPFEDELRRRGIRYRLVGGKEYYVRDEVRALGAVLRAIDNPADRNALVMALRSPFFALSDDELFGFAATGGTLHYLAPIPEGARGAELFGAVFELLAGLHRLRRVAPPSEVIESLFSRTRALSGFLLRPSGEQSLANLWKVRDVARAYEAVGPATLRGLVQFLEGEAQSGREEGDSPVGEEAGASVQILTVHKAKGLEYPIVIVGDLLSDTFPKPDAILDHAAGQGWLKIGGFEPAGWTQRAEWEERQREAEERRLLYVALTRARDHLVLPCFAGERRPGWLDGVLAGVVAPGVAPPCGQPAPTLAGAARVTWCDTNALALDVASAPSSSRLATVAGGEDDARAGARAEDAWVAEQAAIRAAARAAPRASLPVLEDRRDAGEAGWPELAAELVLALLLSPPEAVAPAARALAARHRLPDAEAARLVETVTRMLSQPPLAAAKAADRVLRAVPWKHGSETGVLDVAYRADGRWTVVQLDRGGGDGRAAAATDPAAARRAFEAAAGAAARFFVCRADGTVRPG